MIGNEPLDFGTQVKLNIYETIAETTETPSLARVARALGAPEAAAAQAFQDLAAKRLLVLEPGDPSRIRMAPPFAGIETPFRAEVGAQTYFANCAWDAFGVAAALHRDAAISSTCEDCGESIELEIVGGQPIPEEAAVHFAVPAAQWWDDIIYT